MLSGETMASPPPKPPRYPAPKRLLLALAAFIPLSVGVHLLLDHFVSRLGVPGYAEEIIEGILLILIIGLPLFHVCLRHL
ncbi:MAG: hypothetical protein HYY66_08455, partial [Candidatus Tectomicrobia bacterium]|nr:hypothetical protein [Candidatus Tectomicrobia bacterium]